MTNGYALWFFHHAYTGINPKMDCAHETAADLHDRRADAVYRWLSQASDFPDCIPDEIRSITAESCSVVTSPSERFSATSLSRRRMILPERVFGNSATSMIWRGLAIGPSTLATWLRNSTVSCSPF